MAKLEDQVTPIELLNIIRGGTVKNDVLKEYRTTDQELAKMLLPLYRSGELSMEEFNDFFKGVPLTPKKPDDEAQGPSVPRPEDEAPSEILRSLSEDRGGKSAENSRKADAKPEPEPLAFPESSASPEPPMASVESAIVEEIQAEELFEEGELEEEFLEEPDIEVEGALQPEVDMKDLEAVLPPKAPAPAVEPPPPASPPAPRPEVRALAVVAEKPAPVAAETASSDPVAVRKALDAILSKLSSMEGLLARIEKHLRKP